MASQTLTQTSASSQIVTLSVFPFFELPPNNPLFCPKRIRWPSAEEIKELAKGGLKIEWNGNLEELMRQIIKSDKDGELRTYLITLKPLMVWNSDEKKAYLLYWTPMGPVMIDYDPQAKSWWIAQIARTVETCFQHLWTFSELSTGLKELAGWEGMEVLLTRREKSGKRREYEERMIYGSDDIDGAEVVWGPFPPRKATPKLSVKGNIFVNLLIGSLNGGLQPYELLPSEMTVGFGRNLFRIELKEWGMVADIINCE